MKKLFVLSLALVLVTLLVSCNSTKPTNAVETSQETTVAIEETTETVVETTVETSLNYYKLEATVTETTETKETETTTSTTTETAVATIVVNNRQTTGDSQRLGFIKGSTVCGAAIEINGHTFTNCVIVNSPMDGVVISGVIWPWDSEITGLILVNNDEILAPVAEPTATASTPTESTATPTESTATPTESTATPTESTATPTESTTIVEKVRIPTGSGQSLAFEVGDTVVGWSISVNGQTYEGGVVLYNSPYSGIVIDGVINPWTSEITTQTVISP